MKKCFSMLLTLLLCLSSLACAEQIEGPLFKARLIFDSPAQDCDVLIFSDSSKGEGIVTIDGKVLCNAKFGSLSWRKHGYFEATNDNNLSSHGLVDKMGNTLIPFEYSVFEVISDRWVGAIVLTPTNQAEGDYSAIFGSGQKYNIDHVDFYRLPEGTLVGTLNRQSYLEARAVGQDEYLLVKDRTNGLTLYNSTFHQVDHLFRNFTDAEFLLYKPNNLSKEEVYSAVTCEKREDIIADRFDTIYMNVDKYMLVQKAGDYGLTNTAGELITEIDLPYIRGVYEDRYVVVNGYIDKKSYYGVYDLNSQSMILPLAYDDINPRGDTICYKGYFQVEIDNKVGYVDTDNNVTCPIEYSESSIEKQLNSCFVVRSGNGLTLVAADGVTSDLSALGVEEVGFAMNGSDGTYFEVKNAEGKYGIIDWHGNVILDYNLSDRPSFYRDGYFSLDGEIYHIS